MKKTQMKRTQIYITERQQEILRQISKNSGLGTAELIRRAIDDYLLKLKEQEM